MGKGVWIGLQGSPEAVESQPGVFSFDSREPVSLMPGLLIVPLTIALLVIPIWFIIEEKKVVAMIVYPVFLCFVSIGLIKSFWWWTRHEIDCARRQISVSYRLGYFELLRKTVSVMPNDYFAIVSMEPNIKRGTVFFHYVFLCNQVDPKLCVTRLVTDSSESADVLNWVTSFSHRLNIRSVGYRRTDEISTFSWRFWRLFF
jgi:hypothetical protein